MKKCLVDFLLNVHIILLGIIKNGGKYQKFETYLFILFIIHDLIVFVGLCFAFIRAETYAHRTWIVSLIPVTISNILLRVVGHKKRSLLLSIMKRFKFDSSYFSMNNMENNTYLTVEKNFGLVLNIFFSSFVIFVMVPYMRSFFVSDGNYNNPDLYLVPHFFHFWDIHSFWEYLALTFLINVVLGFSVILPASGLLSFAYISSNINAHVKEMNEQFNCLINTNVVPISTKENEKSLEWIIVLAKSRQYESLYEGLMAIIKYQQFLQR